jgi:hypothetical protein
MEAIMQQEISAFLHNTVDGFLAAVAGRPFTHVAA